MQAFCKVLWYSFSTFGGFFAMSATLPLFISCGPDRPDFYAVLKECGVSARRKARATISGNPVPDPLYRLPNLRPSREFWGVREGQPSAAKIASTAKSSGLPGKTAKTSAKPASKVGNLVSAAFRLAKALFDEEDEDDSFSSPTPSYSSGLLGGKKPEPA